LALGGEQFPVDFLNRCLENNNKYPQLKTQLFNLYGITEVSCWSTCCKVEPDMLKFSIHIPIIWLSYITVFKIDQFLSRKQVPIGESLLDSEIWIDHNFNKSDNIESSIDNSTGLLYLGGQNRICLLDLETFSSAEKFRSTGDLVSIDRNGEIFYAGRVDNQIKRMGKRINLEQVECVCSYDKPQ